MDRVLTRARRLQQAFLASLPGRTVTTFAERQGPNWAALLAWNALFAMIPIALLVVALLGFVLHFAGVTQQAIYRDIVSVVPGSAQQQVLDALEGARRNTGIFFVLGLVGFLWSGASLFSTMDQAFAGMFGVPQRDMVRQKVMSIAMMLLFVLLVGVTLSTSSVLPLLRSVPLLPDVLSGGPGTVALQAVLGVVAGLILFGAIYFVVPNKPQSVRQIWPGALLAGVLFELLTLLFPAYLSLTGAGNTYGKTFGLLFLLMTYAYFLGLITMLGAALNTVVENWPAYSGATAGVQRQARAAATATETAAEVREPRQPWRSILVLLGLLFGAMLAGRKNSSPRTAGGG